MWLRLLITLSAILCFVADAHSAKRVALIIGNGTYEHFSTLPNPPNDAREIAKALREAKFDTVELVYDLTHEALRDALQKFSSAASGTEIALIYYAGHGVEVDGTNYLVPVDATLLQATSVSFEAIPLDLARTAVSPASGLRMVILDACRNNPFKLANAKGKRGGSRGLRAIEADSSEFIAYSAKEGTTAVDGPPDGNSPFAKALAAAIRKPGLEVRLLFGKVRDDVFKATNKEQEPFTYASLGGEEVYLNPPVAVDPEVEAVVPVPSGIRDAWSAVADSGNVPALIGFKKLYANDPEIMIYGPLIDQKLEEIKQARQVLIEQEQSQAQRIADEQLSQQAKARDAEAKILQEQQAAELLLQREQLAKQKAEQDQLTKQAAEKLEQQKRRNEEKAEQKRLAEQAALEKQEKVRKKQELLAKLASEELQKQEAEKQRKAAEFKLASVDPSVIPANPSPLVNSKDGEAALPPQKTDTALTRSIQVELKRLGCLSKSDRGSWGAKSKNALTKFLDASGDTETSPVPSDPLLTQLQASADETLCSSDKIKAEKTPEQVETPTRKRDRRRVTIEPRVKRTIVKQPRFVPQPRQPKAVVVVKKPGVFVKPAPKAPRQKQVATNAKRKTKRCATWVLVAVVVKPC